MKYHEPPTSDLPRLLAEAIGWKVEKSPPMYKTSPDNTWNHLSCFNPHLSHDHAQICVDECSKRGLQSEFCNEIDDGISFIFGYSPEQKSRSALRALTEGKK